MADSRHFEKPLNRHISATVRRIFTKSGTVTHTDLLKPQPHWTDEAAVYRTESYAPKELRISYGWILAPPDEDEWTIRARRPGAGYPKTAKPI